MTTINDLFPIQDALNKQVFDKHNIDPEQVRDFQFQATLTELGELSNEWRGFKYWSTRQEPNTEKKRHVTIPGYKAKGVEFYNPLLEEYVDCLHFILTLGLRSFRKEYDIQRLGEYYYEETVPKQTVSRQFNYVFHWVLQLRNTPSRMMVFSRLMDEFLILGFMLGFSLDLILDAYMEKNEINYTRLQEGY